MTLQINGKNIGEVRYARDDGTLATVGEARVWDGQWRTVYTSMDTVVILDNGIALGARNQFRAALTDYGLDYRTVTKLPFRLDTSNVTNTYYMFDGCSSLTSVPDLDTSNVTSVSYMFYGCSSLTDGNVRLIGKNRTMSTTAMILNSGLTREPFYDTNGNPI